MRRFVRGDSGLVGKAMLRLYGSDDLFPDAPPEDAYHAFQSVNYIGSHDGLSLNDLVSYNEKNNWDNGHQNTDGPSENFSYDYGHAGTVGVPADVAQIRRQQVKNFATLLFLANGTPMFRAGDEFLKTQGGNSNPYNQDNETSWLDWGALDENRLSKVPSQHRPLPILARRRALVWYSGDGGRLLPGVSLLRLSAPGRLRGRQ
jgi:glycogen operon protein